MAYTPNRKKNGIGREYRGRKPLGFDKRIQDIVDNKVKILSKELGDMAVAQLKKRKGRPPNTSHQLILEPDSDLNLDELYSTRSSKYTPADKIAAATAWMVTGSLQKASAYCGIPDRTIATWRTKEWWQQLTAQVRKEKSDELDAMMTGVLHKAVDAVADRIENGDSFVKKDGTIAKIPMKGKDIASSLAMIFDKRALGRGDPTSRSEKVSTDTRLKQLKEQFEKFSNAKEIEGTAEAADDSTS